MTIKKLVTGYLKKLNLKRSGKISDDIINRIIAFQQQYPKAVLCGSAALILSGILPYRKMSDIDFILNIKDFNNNLRSTFSYDPYSNEDDGYKSYSKTINGIKFNILVFDDSYTINTKKHTLSQGEIKLENINDILYWKKKYNRPKDQKDLENINKAFEDAIFGG